MSRSELLIALTAEVDTVERSIIDTLDVEALAVMHVELADLIRRLRDAAQTVEERLAEVMPDKRLELPGLPVLERRRGTTRRQWQSTELLQRCVRHALDPEGTGELPSSPLAAAHAVVDVVQRVIPVTPSLGWRVTALREIGLDPDEFCETAPGRVTVQIHNAGGVL